jgi:hypothetical protein
MEPAGESGLRGLNDEVVVRAHQAEGVANPVLAIDRLAQETKKDHPVGVVAEDGVGIDAPCGHVVDPVREAAAWRSRHGLNVSGPLPHPRTSRALATLSFRL